jgi:uncharacterized radical SAM superfamily protein
MDRIKELFKRFEEGVQSWEDYEDYLKLNSEEIEPFLQLAFEVKKEHFNNILKIYTPGKRFPAISLTGDQCALSCEHCNKKYLKSMNPITNTKDLSSFLLKLSQEGGTGALISGGCLPDGSVPLLNYIEIIQKIKNETDLIINAHTGLLDENLAKKLAGAKVDIISFDLNLDNEIIKDIYHLDKNSEDYIKALNFLQKYKLNIVPHICIGLHYGRLHKELETIKYLKNSELNPSLIVLIALIPPKDTKRKFRTPKPIDIAKIASIIRFVFPKTELSLGCMRPRGDLKIEIEKIALKAGINRIEIPSKKTLNWARKIYPEINYQFYSACCAIPREFEEFALSRDNIMKKYQI